jgi:serine/threonine protein kinase
LPSDDEVATTLVAGARAEAYCSTCNRSFTVDHATCPEDGTLLVRFEDRADPLVGRVLDERYRIDKKLGEGGMGAVYRGRQLSVDREVAIKVMHPALAADREVAKRFLREARLASSLAAPGIVSVFEFGQTRDGILYLVMELIAGTPLDARIKRGRFPPSRIVDIALQLCDALEVAHAAGIVHRDLKPANIILLDTPTGDVVKVLDFGIAKIADAPSITSTLGIVGTPTYMAPEQFDGRADHRSDLYSLGCVLHELASGAPPFTAPEMSALYVRHLNEPPPPVPHDIPHQLAAAITRLLAKEPADRFASVSALRDALAGIESVRVGSAPIIRTSLTPIPSLPRDLEPAPPAPAEHVNATPVRSSKRWLLVGALVLAGVAGLAGFLAMRASSSETSPATAAPAVAPPPAAEVVMPVTPPPAVAPVPAEVPTHVEVAAPAEGLDAGVAAPTPETEPVAPAIQSPPKRLPPKRRPSPPPKKKKPTGETELPFAPT